MKLKDEITSREVKQFEILAIGTNEKTVDRPLQSAQYNDFIVRAALEAKWFVTSFDPDSESSKKINELRKEIEMRYADEIGLSEEAKELEKNS